MGEFHESLDSSGISYSQGLAELGPPIHETASISHPAVFSECARLVVGLNSLVKLFYTGPVVNAEMLMVMLEKHGIVASQEFVDKDAPDDGDLNRLAKVLVTEADYDRAHELFYSERQDEL
jgi:hypothetical protein